MLAATKGWLRTTWNVSVQEDWLSACIDWIRSEEGADLPGARVQELAYEQWLHADLKDTAVGGCIPPSVAQEQSSTLTGKLIVQVDSVLDVSVPAYAQLQKLKGQELDTAEEHDHEKKEPKPTRLLLLTLNDGFSVIQGMEHKPIPQLSTQTAPGTKLLLQGAIESRQGVLLLRGDQITVLGGVIEELAEKNEQKKILSRILNNEDLAAGGQQPAAAPNLSEPLGASVTRTVPSRMQRNSDQDVIEISDSPVELLSCRSGAHTVPSPVTSIDLSDFENFEEEEVSHNAETDIDLAVVKEMEHTSDLEWEQDFKEPDFELEREFKCDPVNEQEPDLELERDFENEAVYEQEPDIDEKADSEVEPDIDEKADVEVEPDPDTEQNLGVNSDRERNATFHSSSKEDTSGQGSSIHGSSDLTGHSKSHVVPSVGKGSALLALKDLQSSRIWDTCSVVKVKARFASVVEKLQCDNGQWSITVLIVDESGSELKVHLSNKVLETLIGFTAHIEPNRSQPARGRNGFQRCQCALAQLHCIMEITRRSSESLPCVEGLREN
ncbi:hypothetical protein EMCRGX_G034836 [Ephydatia muelleri]